jgi:hypothetical protein
MSNTCPTLVQDFSLYIMASLVKNLDTENRPDKTLESFRRCWKKTWHILTWSIHASNDTHTYMQSIIHAIFHVHKFQSMKLETTHISHKCKARLSICTYICTCNQFYMPFECQIPPPPPPQGWSSRIVHMTIYLGPLYTRSQSQKNSGTTLSIFGLQIGPQVTTKC